MDNFLSDDAYFIIVIWLFFAAITSYLAAKRKRNIINWLLIGILFGIFGIIIIILFPPKNKKEIEVKHTDKLNSRLKYLKIKEEFEEYKKKKIEPDT